MIEGIDKSPYMRFNKYDAVAASNESTVIYILTMGHRIHFILGDPINNKVIHVLTRLFGRFKLIKNNCVLL